MVRGWDVMKNKTKKERAHRLFQDNMKLFRCPFCSHPFIRSRHFGLRCSQGHNFDLARNGYCNFLASAPKNDYQRDLFLARRRVFKAGLYQPLIVEISKLILDQGWKSVVILDAGCGEGSLLSQLYLLLAPGLTCSFLGMDINKEGIRLAGALGEPIIWGVADLAQLPLAANSVDAVLNILAPANYGEFKRVLKPGGMVIKVLPGPGYLREIRNQLEIDVPYSNEEVLNHLGKQLKIQVQKRIYYQSRPGKALWPHLLKMTPLTRYRERVIKPVPFLTIELELLKGVYPQQSFQKLRKEI